MNKKQLNILRLVQNNETAAKAANEVALKQFRQNPEIQLLFAPLLGEVRGMGSMVAAELAWKLFILIREEGNGDEGKETAKAGGQ